MIAETAPALLNVKGLVKKYGHGSRSTPAVNGVDFVVRQGTTLGLVGESGSGKSTIGYCVLRIVEPTEGSVRINGRELIGMGKSALRQVRREAQMVFQDPYESLDPKMTVEQIVSEPLIVHRSGNRAERRDRVKELLEQVGLDSQAMERYPRSFSGGQRQRIGIARALALRPKLLVCDEAVSALDVSVQAQILNLLRDLQDALGLSYLFISHDLAVIRAVADDVLVLREGKVVEFGPADDIFRSPKSVYTQQLINAVPLVH